ncbi:hypothetical protein GOP47_0017127 [Adiantum capillus-veneris]|uniref:Uncharacterized protein n=1 Tax=Adiantum capillus-veneris TaxID=13818 RepID=A0A9D4ZCC0_ADICA|nr:hypothetical protein GOP47_0017127 [Adiantum capillus-veneris]
MFLLLQKAALALLLLASTSLLQLKKSAAQRAHHFLLSPGTPASLPAVLGCHLQPFLGERCPHRALTLLARLILGPLIGLHLGPKLAVAICNSDLAKEILHARDKLLFNRRHCLIVNSVFYGCSVSIKFTIGNNQPKWVVLRKLCAVKLFTARRLQALQHLRKEEAHRVVESPLQGSCGGTQAVQLGQLFAVMIDNTYMSRMLHTKTQLADVGGQGFATMLKEQEGKIENFPRKCKGPIKKLHDCTSKIIEKMVSQWRKRMKSTPTTFVHVGKGIHTQLRR